MSNENVTKANEYTLLADKHYHAGIEYSKGDKIIIPSIKKAQDLQTRKILA